MITFVNIETSRIVDWDSFHTVFAEALGFPDFYGRNGNAWIDCLIYDDDIMSIPFPPPGGLLAITLKDAVDFFGRCPEQVEAMLAWTAAVNDQRREDGTSLMAIVPEGYSNTTIT
jgi:hypothetical protein